MNIPKKAKISAVAVFLAVEAALYITFMVGLPDRDTDIAVKYSGVCICALFALLCCHTFKVKDFLLIAALVFTLVSDWFLLVTGENIDVGLVTFTVAQLIHFARITLIRGKVPKVSIILRVLLPCAAIAVMAFMDGWLSLTTALVAVYFSQLVMNFADSFALIKKDRMYILLCMGMFLFICCDINVGLYNMSAFTSLDIPDAVVNFSEYAMWAFYLPSQVCIVMTGGLSEK